MLRLKSLEEILCHNIAEVEDEDIEPNVRESSNRWELMLEKCLLMVFLFRKSTIIRKFDKQTE